MTSPAAAIASPQLMGLLNLLAFVGWGIYSIIQAWHQGISPIPPIVG